MLRTNLLQKSEIRMKPKSTRETWKVPVKLKFHTGRETQNLAVTIFEKMPVTCL